MRALLRAVTRGPVTVLELDTLDACGVDAVVTTRLGGVSDPPYDTWNLGDYVGDDPTRVVENRARLARAMGVDATNLVTLRQVHGADVVDLDEWRGEELVGDAVTTTRRDLALCVLVADCVPVALADTRGGRVTLAHAGWRGLAAGVLRASVATFDDPSRVHALIGPHISPARYQVGPDVAHVFADVPGALTADEGDRSRLDLGAVARAQLRGAGLDDGSISHLGQFSDDQSLFFSDRRTRPCGRFALVARLRATSKEMT